MLNVSFWLRAVCAVVVGFIFSLNISAVGQQESTEQESKGENAASESKAETSSNEGDDTIIVRQLKSETILPASTKAWISIPDSDALKEAINKTQFGQMMEDENVKPFVDDLTQQFRDWLDEKNIRFGIKVADIEAVESGEIALAGVLQDAPVGEDAPLGHAIVLMVDVKDSKAETVDLLNKVGDDLRSREATEEELTIGEIKATKWSFKKPRGLREKSYAYHAIVGDWLLACDNETVFRQMIRRITTPAARTAVLAKSAAFTRIGEKSQFEGKDFVKHIRWFVEPFGYVQLAQAISDAETGGTELRDDNARIFQEQGFSAIKGVGGMVSVATGDHELVHRTFIYAPPEIDGPEKYKRAAAMLDFRNTENSDLAPPAWIPEDSASYLSFTWDLRKALEKVGFIIDKTSGTDGSWERTLNSIRDDPNGPRVDVRDMVSALNNRITVASVTQLPIDESSERILIGIKITGDEARIADQVKRMVKQDAEIIPYKKREILLVDTTKLADEELPLDLENLEELDEFGDDPLIGDEGKGDEDEELEKPKPLFEQRVFLVTNGYLLIGNNVDFVKQILDRLPESPGDQLAQAEDYVRINTALNGLVDASAPSFRHFGRMDKAIRTNYEMMRQGKMAQSKTVLAQLLNRAFTKDDAPDDFVRQQQIDGSKMPADYDKHVAKYFGPTGLLVQTVDDGWLITGCVLTKEEISTTEQRQEVAEKTSALEDK